jgi:putative spermidine/putrescine transport system ATP-binding protein
VVRDVDLDIRAGEFMTFLGPSGSGKTTTLNMIAGFVEPTNGDVLVDGRSVRAVPTHKRGMGMVFQGYTLFPHLSVGDNVGFPLKQRGIAKKKRRQLVQEALGTVELDGFADRSPRELSGGQQQRVSLARAIVYRPPVLLMDEPLGALDKRLRDALQEEIRAIHRQIGTTFVYVTHDQEEALQPLRPDRGLQRRENRTGGDTQRPLRPAGNALRRALSRGVHPPAWRG